MSELVTLPAVLFLPWVLSLIAFARWKKYPGSPMSLSARIGVVVAVCCVAATLIVAANVFGSIIWFLLMVFVWMSASWWLLRRLMS